MINFSNHALVRMSQTALTEEEILYVINHGERHYRAGAMFFLSSQVRHSRMGTTGRSMDAPGQNHSGSDQGKTLGDHGLAQSTEWLEKYQA